MDNCVVRSQSLNPREYDTYWTNGHRVLAHRVEWERANGRPVPEGLVVRHKCDNPRCINPDHLEIGTHKDNSDDKIRRGRYRNGGHKTAGSAHAHTNLTEDQVLEIRAEREAGDTYAEIMERHGIAKSTLSYIINRRTWRHI